MARTRAEITIGKALRDASNMALERMLLVGDARVPEMAGMQLARVLTRYWAQSIRSEGRKVQRAIGELEAKADDTLWDQFLAEYIRLYGGQAITDILETTRRQIVEAVEKGLREGKGIDVIAKEMRERVPSLARSRARVIARTETHSAAQYASIQTAKTARFPLVKTWNSAYDPRTRDFGEGDGIVDQGNHRAMNGVSVALDEPFMVPNKWGGFDPMQFPGDQSAPAYQCVNCRCAMSYKRASRVIA